MNASDELLLKLKPLEDQGLLQIRNEASVVSSINERFPFIGSKIDWNSVPGSIAKRFSSGDELVQRKSFLEDCLCDEEATLSIAIVGDGIMHFGIETSLSNIGCCLDDVLELPQHTYITTPLCEWCMVFTTEGDMCFGNAPIANSVPGSTA